MKTATNPAAVTAKILSVNEAGDDVSISVSSADCYERGSHTENEVPAVRLYRSSPGAATLQVRTFGPITNNRRGVSRNMIASAPLGILEAVALRDLLDAFIAENSPAQVQQ